MTILGDQPIPVPAQVHPEPVTPRNLNPYLNLMTHWEPPATLLNQLPGRKSAARARSPSAYPIHRYTLQRSSGDATRSTAVSSFDISTVPVHSSSKPLCASNSSPASGLK
jgi:hypothetical protein